MILGAPWRTHLTRDVAQERLSGGLTDLRTVVPRPVTRMLRPMDVQRPRRADGIMRRRRREDDRTPDRLLPLPHERRALPTPIRAGGEFDGEPSRLR